MWGLLSNVGSGEPPVKNVVLDAAAAKAGRGPGMADMNCSMAGRNCALHKTIKCEEVAVGSPAQWVRGFCGGAEMRMMMMTRMMRMMMLLTMMMMVAMRMMMVMIRVAVMMRMTMRIKMSVRHL